MDLQERLANLEFQYTNLARSNRRLRTLLTAMLLVTCAASVIGMNNADPPELTLRQLRIVDDKGRDRILLNGLGPDGASSILLRDSNGTERVRIATGADGTAGVAHLDKAGVPRVITMTKDRSAGVTHYDRHGTQRIATTTERNSTAGVVYSDMAANRRIGIVTTPDGAAGMTQYDKLGQLRLLAGTASQGKAEVLGFGK